jgi:hypothetical protein
MEVVGVDRTAILATTRFSAFRVGEPSDTEAFSLHQKGYESDFRWRHLLDGRSAIGYRQHGVRVAMTGNLEKMNVSIGTCTARRSP